MTSKMRFLVLIIILCLFASLSHAEERWALLVGIDKYSSSIITPLKGAVSDAHALRDALVKYAGFSPNNIFLLTSDNSTTLPNLGNIVTKLDYIASKARPGDVFLLFFAGHGIFSGDQNYLLTYESDIRPLLLPKTGLSVEELSAYLAKIQSGNTILILDACRNNPRAGRGDEDNVLTPGFARSVSNIKFRATIYACDTGQRAYEYPGRGRGFFSMALEEALSGKADSDKYGERDGRVTLGEVNTYLATEVPDRISRELGSGRTQTPRIDMRGDPRAGDMVLAWTTMTQDSVEANSAQPGEAIAPRELVTQQDSAIPQAPHQLSPLEKIRQKASGAFAEMDQEFDAISKAKAERAAGWVDATGECHGESLSLIEARRIALERARRNAIRTALGAEMPSRMTLIVSVQDFQQAFTDLSQFDGYGKIVEENDPIWMPEELTQIHPDKPPVPVQRVALRAKVSHEEGEPDPAFNVSLRLNNAKFLDGEEMILSITPSQDCYITVFEALSDHTVVLMDISPGHTSTMITGQQTTFMPSESERQSGRHLRVKLPEGRIEDVQSVFVVATKDDIPFLPSSGESAPVIMATYQTALEEIGGWLMSIPPDRRAFDIQQYKISEK